ncbi:MAG: 3-deoxy-7-phosphoheptulonate synthase [Clostridia bacterium]|nr:3-deoxy-7-phosphoheptulonate synthase [Clostridia bacterium]
MNFIRKLPIPQEIKEQYPLSEELVAKKKEFDREVAAVFTGESKKFLLIIGPCSADNEESVMDYTMRLADLQKEVKDKVLIIPRVYTNKPRTTGDGYKGMVHQPDPTHETDMLQGLIAIRRLHTRVAAESGMFPADEMLYPENFRYLSDILSYVAVGARSVENQQHRLVASGISVPVGMKNPTSGDFSVMMNSIMAGQHQHMFLYRGWEVQSEGNPLAHAILRGYVNKHGQSLSNYHYEDLRFVYEQYMQKGLENPAVIVDTNHANSGKKYNEQIRIAKEVLHSRRYNSDIEGLVKGLMIESYIEDGAQKIGEGKYGCSITDPCLGWEKSKKLVLDIADSL